MQSVNNDPRINCPNANWNGDHDELLQRRDLRRRRRHEWGHAYTQFTHNLIYQWQPGALNESYSDIWGETVDLINKEGTDTPANPVRTVGNCSSLSRAAPGSSSTARPRSPASARGRRVVRARADRDRHDRRRGARERRRPPGTSTTAARRSRTARRWPGRSRSSTAVPARSRSRSRTPRTPARSEWSSPTSSSASRRPMSGVDPTITIPSVNTTLDHGNLMKGQIALGNPVNVTMRDKAGTRGLVPVAHGRGLDRVRRRDPRHVEPALPLRPGQGHRRRVPLRHQRRRRRPHELGRAEPRLRPARGRRHVQRPHGRGDRPDEGRAHLLARAVGLPDRGERVRRPRGRARGVVHRPDRRQPDRAQHRRAGGGRPVRRSRPPTARR